MTVSQLNKIIFSVIVLSLLSGCANGFLNIGSTGYTPPTQSSPQGGYDPLLVSASESSPPDIITISQQGWQETNTSTGIKIYHDQTNLNNYLFLVNPTTHTFEVQNQFQTLYRHFDHASNPQCVFNGGFFEPDGTPTLTLISSSNIITGKKDGEFSGRIILNQGTYFTYQDLPLGTSSSVAGISGLKPSFYKNDSTITNRTIIGLLNGYLVISITQNKTVDSQVKFLEQFGVVSDSITVLDSGLSTQFKCVDALEFIAEHRKLGSVIVVNFR